MTNTMKIFESYRGYKNSTKRVATAIWHRRQKWRKRFEWRTYRITSPKLRKTWKSYNTFTKSTGWFCKNATKRGRGSASLLNMTFLKNHPVHRRISRKQRPQNNKFWKNGCRASDFSQAGIQGPFKNSRRKTSVQYSFRILQTLELAKLCDSSDRLLEIKYKIELFATLTTCEACETIGLYFKVFGQEFRVWEFCWGHGGSL